MMIKCVRCWNIEYPVILDIVSHAWITTILRQKASFKLRDNAISVLSVFEHWCIKYTFQREIITFNLKQSSSFIFISFYWELKHVVTKNFVTFVI